MTITPLSAGNKYHITTPNEESMVLVDEILNMDMLQYMIDGKYQKHTVRDLTEDESTAFDKFLSVTKGKNLVYIVGISRRVRDYIKVMPENILRIGTSDKFIIQSNINR